jgi:regulator of sigma E protease
MFVVTLIIFLLILGLLIFVHEGGHFIVAKLSGIKVEEFGLGFPPRIFGIRRGETIYSLNWIPLGGFCKMLGEEDPSEPRSFASKRPAVRLATLGAGPFMNAILPILLLTIAFMVPRQVEVGNVMIEQVAPDSPASEAGIAPGDTLLSINGHTIKNIGDVIYDINLELGNKITLELKDAEGNLKTAEVVPRWNPPPDQGAVGIEMSMVPTGNITQSDPFWKAVPKSISSIKDTFVLMGNQITSWVAQKKAPEVTGPVGIFQLTGEVRAAGPSYLLQFIGFISMNLAIVNILPLPALDGGRIAFVFLEVVRRGKRVSPRTEGLIHYIGFVMLIALILVISYFDIVRVIRGGSLIP